MNPYSLIQCLGQWMHSIWECQLLVDKMLKIKKKTMINLYKRKEDSFELQMDIKIVTPMIFSD